jgi:hypothetical protein
VVAHLRSFDFTLQGTARNVISVQCAMRFPGPRLRMWFALRGGWSVPVIRGVGLFTRRATFLARGCRRKCPQTILYPNCTQIQCGSVGYIAGAWGFGSGRPKRRNPLQLRKLQRANWLRGLDLNQRPSGYEPDELPGCSTPRSAPNLRASQALHKLRIARSDRFVATLSPLFKGVFGVNADHGIHGDLRFRFYTPVVSGSHLLQYHAARTRV